MSVVNQDLFLAGKIVKKVGFKGHISLKLTDQYPIDYKQMVQIYLDFQGAFVPFLIEDIHSNGKFLKAKLVGVDTEPKADNLIGKTYYLPKSLIPKSKDGFYYSEIEGFEVLDQDSIKIGKVAYVIDQTVQPILQVEAENETHMMIPLVEELILDLDFEKKFIQMEIAEGLLELYQP